MAGLREPAISVSVTPNRQLPTNLPCSAIARAQSVARHTNPKTRASKSETIPSCRRTSVARPESNEGAVLVDVEFNHRPLSLLRRGYQKFDVGLMLYYPQDTVAMKGHRADAPFPDRPAM